MQNLAKNQTHLLSIIYLLKVFQCQNDDKNNTDFFFAISLLDYKRNKIRKI